MQQCSTKQFKCSQKARQREDAASQKGKPVDTSCPFRKQWGLQTDGDLWKIAWHAILARGSRSQILRKVKGHATTEDIRQGRSTVEDRDGNDRSDTNADQGVAMVAGRGFVVLGKWLGKRHNDYCKLMAKIHKMIARVTLAEKEERAKDKQVQKALLGYDPEVWMETAMEIRSEDRASTTYEKLDMPPPRRGKHKFHYCDQLYRDIHRFMDERKRTGVTEEEEIGGITWTEMFILFDTGNYRSHGADHIKDPGAKKRADA